MTLQEFIEAKSIGSANVGAVRADAGELPDYIADLAREDWPSIEIDEVIVGEGPILRLFSKQVEERLRSFWEGRIEVQIQRLHVFTR